MLKITVVGLISAVLAAGLLGLKFIAYDTENESDVGDIFGTFDLLKDFMVLFMLLWYVLKLLLLETLN